MASKWDDLRRQILSGMNLPEGIVQYFSEGGSAEDLTRLLGMRSAIGGLQQQEQQQAMQPVRMGALEGMAEQLDQPAFNPYATTPSALPNLPGIQGGGTVGSSPGAGVGLGVPDFSGLGAQLGNIFEGLRGAGPGSAPQPDSGGGGTRGGQGGGPIYDKGEQGEPDQEEPTDPCAGMTGAALQRCRERHEGPVID